MKKLLNIIRQSVMIKTSLVILVFVTGFSIGYQMCLYYTTGTSAFFGSSQLSKSVENYNANIKGGENECE